MRKPIVLSIDPSPKNFGLLGFLCMLIGVAFAVSFIYYFNEYAMVLGVLMFIFGGFSGRSFEKRNKIRKNKKEVKPDVHKRLQTVLE